MTNEQMISQMAATLYASKGKPETSFGSMSERAAYTMDTAIAEAREIVKRTKRAAAQ